MMTNEINTDLPVFSEDELLPYTVGALLYSPATNNKISSMIAMCKYGTKYSLALCLEDSISDSFIATAEEQLNVTFQELFELHSKDPLLWIPKLFIRVREPQQLLRIFHSIEAYSSILTGFILPKYTTHCAEEYSNYIKSINNNRSKIIYIMPIIESSDIINPFSRATILNDIKQQLSNITEYVLNIRVGGNDFCKEFGIRRHNTNTIYEISALHHILGDIIATFSRDYIVSGPVWEYFSGITDDWKVGLFRETKYDLLNGFIGKTVIHPNQISVVNSALQVSLSDYQDALSIYHYNNSAVQVEKSVDGTRMNEIKTHRRWANKILILAHLYGVAENEL